MNAQDILKFMQGGGDLSSLAGAIGGNMAALLPLLKNLQGGKEGQNSSAPVALPAEPIDLTLQKPLDL